MKIDVILDSRASPQEIADLGALAESYGIGAVWTSSLLDARDPFVNFTALAQNTKTLRFGPIAVNPYDMHPVRITTSLLSLNEIAQGRTNIVIGGGGEALEALKIEPEKRVRAVRECIEIIKQANADEALTYEGGLYHVEGYHPHWATASAPHVYAASNMPQMLSMAARTADGIFLSDLTPTLVTNAVKTAKQAQSGRPTSGTEFQFNNFFAWHVYDNAGRGRQEAKQWLALRGLFRRWVITSFLSEDDYDLIDKNLPHFFKALGGDMSALDHIPPPINDELIDNLTLSGDPHHLDPIMEKLEAFKAAGLTEIALRLYANPADSIRLIGTTILPAL